MKKADVFDSDILNTTEYGAGLHEALEAYGSSDFYPFHMPGHKRNPAFMKLTDVAHIDITEIDGFDNMHRPEGIIKAGQEKAARLYGAKETRYLVNGSSAGNMAAVMGCVAGTGKNKVLMAVNCHKSVYHGVEMARCQARFMTPEILDTLGIYGAVSPETVRLHLEAEPEVAAVVITSPTYEGIVSDVQAIADVCHAFGVPLVVDEAHGAHFGFHPAFPQTAVRLGADFVIQSLHKTLPSLTQTALLHINTEDEKLKNQVLKYYSYLQTTSPSYVMMASMSACMDLLEVEAAGLFEAYKGRIERFLDRCKSLNKVRIMAHPGMDMSKFVVFLDPVRACGKWLYDLLLYKYHLTLEMASRDYVLAMTSICDTDEGFERLYQALAEIDAIVSAMSESELPVYPVFGRRAVCCQELSLYETSCRETESVLLMESSGRLSAEYAYIYPPGVPLIIPGVRIEAEALQELQSYAESGFVIEGLKDLDQTYIEVVKE